MRGPYKHEKYEKYKEQAHRSPVWTSHALSHVASSGSSATAHQRSHLAFPDCGGGVKKLTEIAHFGRIKFEKIDAKTKSLSIFARCRAFA